MLTDKIWERIKGTARRNAAKGLQLSAQDSERVVDGIVRSEDGPFPQAAIEFYGRELIRLTAEGRRGKRPALPAWRLAIGVSHRRRGCEGG